MELLLQMVRQSAQYLRSSVADMIEELPVGQRAVGNPKHQVNKIK